MAEISLILKATLVLATGLVAVRLARRSSASVRALILMATLGVLPLLPAVSLLVLAREVTIPIGPGPAALLPPDAAPDLDIELSAAPASANVVSTRPWTLSLSAADVMRMLWMAGVVAVLCPLAAAGRRVRSIRLRAARWDDGVRLTAAIARQAGVRSDVDVLISNETQAPMTYGVRRPRIILPIDAPRWTGHDLRHALLHEIEHVRRHDWLAQVIAHMACAIYWFHPLAWSAWRHLRLECERACDDGVLREADRTAYAEQLVALARRLSHDRATTMVSMAGSSHLATRIAAVLAADVARGRASVVTMTAVAGAALSLVAAVAPIQAVTARLPAQSANEALSIATSVDGPPFDAALIEPNDAPAPRQAPPTTSPPPAAFDAISIKRNRTSDPARGSLQPGRFTTTNTPVLLLVRQAYDVFPYQILEAPDWTRADGYDITATAPAGAELTPPVVGHALRELLATRFHFAAHTETREMATYELVFARPDRRPGPRRQQSAIDCSASMAAPAPPSADGQPPCAQLGFEGRRYLFRGFPLARFARSLASAVGRPVVDKTGLDGAWNLDLEFTPQNDPGAQPGDHPGIFTALEEQLGLKLQPARGTVDVLIVDRVERPTED